jgi:hypothetical protein
MDIVEIRFQATVSEDIEDLAYATKRNRVGELVKAL